MYRVLIVSYGVYLFLLCCLLLVSSDPTRIQLDLAFHWWPGILSALPMASESKLGGEIDWYAHAHTQTPTFFQYLTMYIYTVFD